MMLLLQSIFRGTFVPGRNLYQIMVGSIFLFDVPIFNQFFNGRDTDSAELVLETVKSQA